MTLMLISLRTRNGECKEYSLKFFISLVISCLFRGVVTGVMCYKYIYHIYVINRIEDYKKKRKVKEFSHPADNPFLLWHSTGTC